MESQMFSAIEQRVRRRQFIHDVGEWTKIYFALGVGVFAGTIMLMMAIVIAAAILRAL